MFPAPQDNNPNGVTDNNADNTAVPPQPPVNGDAVPKDAVAAPMEQPVFTAPVVDNDVVMTDASAAAAASPTSVPIPNNNNNNSHPTDVMPPQAEQQPPAPAAASLPETHGVAFAPSPQELPPAPVQQLQQQAAPIIQEQQQPTQPPLGRMASAGDTQPRLAERQDSVGVQGFGDAAAAGGGTTVEAAQKAVFPVAEPVVETPIATGGEPNDDNDNDDMEVEATIVQEAPPVQEEPVAAVMPVELAPALPPVVVAQPPAVADASAVTQRPQEAAPPVGLLRPIEAMEAMTAEEDAATPSIAENLGVVAASEGASPSVTKPEDPPAATVEAAPAPTNGDAMAQEATENAGVVDDAPALQKSPEAPAVQAKEENGTALPNEAVPAAAAPPVLPPGPAPNESPAPAQPEMAQPVAAAAGVPPQDAQAALPPAQNPAAPLQAGPAGPGGIANPAAAPGGMSVENGAIQQPPAGGVPPGPPQPPPPPAAGAGAGAGAGPFGGMKELRVEDALLYLDDVKREFGDRPRIYNEFLAIMKNFKSQEVDTPGVIARVSKLFRGYNNLILGFNKFLPDGFKISMDDLRQQDAAYAREQEILRQQQAAMEAKAQQLQVQREQQVGGAPMMGAMGMGPPGLHGQLQASSVLPPSQQLQLQQQEEEAARQQQQARLPPKQQKPKGRKAPQPAAPSQAPAQQQQPLQHQAVEFDHAISYVTTIKRRFANDPGTYHAFLEILHTYQKEQRGIKEVLEQVAHLFQDHPDLLKEFTFFLPDAVQEQAKERLHRAAAESESRLAGLRAKKNAMDIDQQQVIDMTGHGLLIDSDGRGRKRAFNDDGATPIAFPQTPESYVYNSAVERQFFDAAKEALASYTRDGGQAWAEFMKCLDMYAQEILSRSEMLNFVEPLLGKRNNKLFEEFKRILAAAGGRGTSTAPPMEDSWYSVPLSEIDFSRCRRCSPSYRALPRDYPAPPCSQRSDEEAKVLNDVWVSLPVGSEESYTFRHMRRNTYEETLFRVEDERFEIDMTIDSNTCTLALLEPFAEEMAVLSVNELAGQVDLENEQRANAEQKGLGGKYFQYTFDPSILGVIHRNSIVRIYGEQGPEILELLKNNPSVAIPIVVKRLRQKDEEWRRVRDRLNRHWKEQAESNYYKSLDHRSLTWRTTDKRAISTRTLISEIKDRAANNGNEGHVALQARIDKAKEEHGTFYEVTMANVLKSKMDLSNLPKPDRRLFTPHMSFMYENNSWVQRDAYRILSFALERGSISPTDKERCHRLWTEFLGPWFSLSLNWMLSPAVNYLDSSSAAVSRKSITRVVTQDDGSPDEEESPDEDVEMGAGVVTEEASGFDDNDGYSDHHPLPVGSTVSTVYGEGRVLQCRKEDGMYEVKLPLGNAFLRPSAVLCSILAAEKSAYTTQRRNDDRTKLDRPDDKLVIGTQSLYLFFRLHQILCRRLGIAKRLAYEVKKDASLQTLVEQMPGSDAAALGRRRYDAFVSLVYALLDGGTGNAAEGGKYEDRVRSLLGHGGHELATMDKLISHISKNIQSMANDDTMWSLVQLYRRHADAGGFKPEAFRQEAAFLSDGEQMYAFQECPMHKDGGEKSVLYMEYLGVISGSDDEDGSLSDPAPEPTTKRQKR
ncbi:MAG: hypothetical protein SGILL_001142 [Bacillariaceae sp.]